MIKLANFEVNEKSVTKIVDRFKSVERPRLEKLWKYYDADNDILQRTQEAGKPNNKLACAYAKYITTIQTGYFMGINVKYSSSDALYLSEYKNVLKDNFEEDVNFELAKSAAIFGHSAELLYQNEKSQTKFKKLDPKETILIFASSIEEFLLSGIRLYEQTDLEGEVSEIAVVYDSELYTKFERKAKEKEFKLKEEAKLHNFSDVPIIVYKNNEEMKSDFEDVIRINDSYDTAQSNTANDVDYFNDAYLVIDGANELADADSDQEAEASGEDQTAQTLRKRKVLFFPDGGGAKFLVKDINDTATENYKNRLNSDIHKFSLTPDLADEKFAGNLSGIAIRFKTIPLEQSAKPKENKFRVGFTKRRELITDIINKLKNKDYDYRNIEEEFTRNLPQNVKEQTETVLALSEYISKKTLLELLPQIEDADKELTRIEQEQDEYDKKDYQNFEDNNLDL